MDEKNKIKGKFIDWRVSPLMINNDGGNYQSSKNLRKNKRLFLKVKKSLIESFYISS